MQRALGRRCCTQTKKRRKQLIDKHTPLLSDLCNIVSSNDVLHSDLSRDPPTRVNQFHGHLCLEILVGKKLLIELGSVTWVIVNDLPRETCPPIPT